MKKQVSKLDKIYELKRAASRCEIIRVTFEKTGTDLNVLDKDIILIIGEINNEICILNKAI